MFNTITESTKPKSRLYFYSRVLEDVAVRTEERPELLIHGASQLYRRNEQYRSYLHRIISAVFCRHTPKNRYGLFNLDYDLFSSVDLSGIWGYFPEKGTKLTRAQKNAVLQDVELVCTSHLSKFFKRKGTHENPITIDVKPATLEDITKEIITAVALHAIHYGTFESDKKTEQQEKSKRKADSYWSLPMRPVGEGLSEQMKNLGFCMPASLPRKKDKESKS